MTKDSALSCLVIGALPSSLVNFRGPLLKAMIAKGHKVFAAANGPNSETEAELRTMGVEYCPIRIARVGINPLADVITFFDLIQLMRRVRPDTVLSYTIKPVIYGGLAAWFYGVRKIFSLIEGLGRAFMPWESFSHALSSIIARILYRIGLLPSERIFFLNPDDLDQFVKGGYVPERKAVLLNGIGIDLAYYAKEQLHEFSCIRFLMITRLLKDKGVREFVEAARIMRSRYPNIEFVLAGPLDENPSSIKQEELDLWQREGVVKYVGQVDDVRPLYRDCHIFVLPSFYREGTPRTTLEALSIGRSVITTDAPGCRETVTFTGGNSMLRSEESTKGLKIGRNGILVPVKNIEALSAAMEFFIKHPEQIAIMGNEGRSYVERRYDVENVNAVIVREMGLTQ